jgi:hypothetical protein
MTSDPNIPPANDHFQSGSVPPPLSPESKLKSGSMRHLLAILLSLCLGLFLADAIVSLADDSLILLFKLHLLAGIRAIMCLFAMLMAIVVYGLMGLTPMIPKRWFLPLTLFYPAIQLALVPFLIYCFGRLQQVSWGFSCGQVILGLSILCWIQGGFKFRWPLVARDQLAGRRFSWWNLSLFGLVNVFGLLPAIIIYLFLCTALAVDHYSEGFMALRPNGFSVEVRKYVRNDGKTIELFPMSHVADARFYQKVSQTFPTNSIILMEGVTDDKSLLTNKISYRRMAKLLGLSEQKEKFTPTRGEMVDADVDVDQFSRDTIDFLNLVMLVHAKGLTPANLQTLMQYSPPPHLEDELINDLLKKRNQRVLEEIQSELSQSDNIMVPWGVAHMPGIAREIQKSGFQLDEAKEYMVIRFRGF